MPRVRRKRKARRLTADDFFCQGWLILLGGWEPPTGELAIERARQIGMETLEQVEAAWTACRDKLMAMRAAAGRAKPWAYFAFDATDGERAVENKRRRAAGESPLRARHIA